MRVLALIAAYNERRFVEPCLSHLERHGVEAYLIDNCSTDNTVDLAERWLNRNLIGIETFPRPEGDVYDWRGLLRRKEQLAEELDADWFIHLDPDEFRTSPGDERTLTEALTRVDGEGFNAVNFREFTFIPTQDEPDHDHHAFQRTLRTYYCFEPRFPHQLNAWKATSGIKLADSGGHEVRFRGLHMHPQPFPFRHYLFLSIPHAIEKYGERNYAPEELAARWHGWRATVTADRIHLPPRSQLRVDRSGQELDSSDARATHWIEWAHPPSADSS